MREPLQSDRLRSRRPTLNDLRQRLERRRPPRRPSPINLEQLRARMISREFQPPPVQPESRTPPHEEPTLAPAAQAEYEQVQADRDAAQPERRTGVLGGIINMLDIYDRNVQKPLAGLALGAVLTGPLRWTEAGQTFAEEWTKSREDGRATNLWEQSREAYEATDTPWGVKFWTEALADPLNFVVGPVGKSIKYGSKGLLMVARGQSDQAAKAVADGVGKVGHTINRLPSNVNHNVSNMGERVSNLFSGQGYKTAKELVDRTNNTTSHMAADQIAGADLAEFEDKARDRLRDLNNLWFGGSPFTDIDRILINQAIKRYEQLTGQKEIGGARSAANRLTDEKVREMAGKTFDQVVRESRLPADVLQILRTKYSVDDIPHMAWLHEWQIKEVAEEAVANRMKQWGGENPRAELIEELLVPPVPSRYQEIAQRGVANGRYEFFDSMSTPQILDEVQKKIHGQVTALRNATQALELFKSTNQWESWWGKAYEKGFFDPRWSPLYWMFKGTRLVADKVFLSKSIAKDYARLSREFFQVESSRGSSANDLVTARMRQHTKRNGDLVNAYESIDGEKPMNALGDVPRHRYDFVDDATGQTPDNDAPDGIKNAVRDTFENMGIEVVEDPDSDVLMFRKDGQPLLIDDVATTGTTLFNMLGDLGETRGFAVAMAHKGTPAEYIQKQWLQEELRVAYPDPSKVTRTLGDALKSLNTRGITGDTADERLRDLMSRPSDHTFSRGGIRFELWVLGDSANRMTNVYGADDVFGMRISWEPFLGKAVRGIYNPDDARRELLRMQIANARDSGSAVFRHTSDGTVVNLTGIDDDDLRYPLHSIEALKNRFHAWWLRQRDEGDFYENNSYLRNQMETTQNYRFERPRNIDGEQIEGMDTHSIVDLLDDDMKDVFIKEFKQDEAIVSYLFNSGEFDESMFDLHLGYLHRQAFAKNRFGADAEFADDGVFKLRSVDAFGKATFMIPRSGALLTNLTNDIVYLPGSETMGGYVQDAIEAVAQQRLVKSLKSHMVFSASADLYAKMHRAATLQGMHTIATKFADDMRSPERRLELLKDEQQIFRLVYAMKRMNEDIGLIEGQTIDTASKKWLEQMGIDAMNEMQLLLDKVTAPGRQGFRYNLRLTGTEPKRDVRDFSTANGLAGLRRTLLSRVRENERAVRVWVPTLDSTTDTNVYVNRLLRSHEDIEDLVADLRETPERLPKKLWLTDPRFTDDLYYDLKGSSDKFMQRGRYMPDKFDVASIANEIKTTTLNDAQINHRRNVANFLRESLEKSTDIALERDLDTFIDAARAQLADIQDVIDLEVTRGEGLDGWLNAVNGLLKDNDIDLDPEMMADLRNWRADIGGSAAFRIGADIAAELDGLRRAGERVGKGVRRKARMYDFLRAMDRRTDREMAERASQMAEAVDDFLKKIGGGDIASVAAEATEAAKKSHKTGEMIRDLDIKTLKENIGIAKRMVLRARAVKESGKLDHSQLEDRPLFGTRPGDDVTGTYYDRSGAYNVVGDIRDMKDTRERFKVRGAGGAEVDHENIIMQAYGVDRDRLPWLAETGYFFTEEGKNAIEKLAVDRSSRAWRVTNAADAANSFLRWANVGFDAGGWMIQGLGVLATRPDIFAASVMRSLPVLADPKHLDDYMLTHFDELWEMMQYGTLLKTSRLEDFRLMSRVQAMRGSGELLRTSHYPGVGAFDAAERHADFFNRPLGGGYGATRGGTSIAATRAKAATRAGKLLFMDVAGRAEAFYNATMIARHMMWRSYKDMWVRFGGTLPELAEHINYMTGFIDLGARGMTQMQQDFERNWLFFSTHYTRSTMALMGTMFEGGVKGTAAKATIASVVAIPTIYYWAIANAVGQEPKMDPRPVSQGGDGARAFTLEIAGNHVGVGTIWTQLVRLMGSLGDVAPNDPAALLKLDIQENPIFRFFRNRIPPVPNAMSDVIHGVLQQPVYLGERLENTGDWAQMLGGRVTPFAFDTTFLQQRVSVNSFIGGLSEFSGLRTFPLSDWDKLVAIRDNIALEEFDKRWMSLNRRQQLFLTNQNPTLRQMQEQLGLNRLERQTGRERDLSLLYDLRYEISRAADREFRSRLTRSNELLGRGEIDTLAYKENALNAFRERRAQRRLQNDVMFEEVEALIQERLEDRSRPMRDIQPAFDYAYQEFQSEVVTAGLNPDGSTDFDERTRARREFRRKYGDDVYNYVKQTWIESLENEDWKYPDALREFFWGRESYDWWWNELPDAVIDQHGSSLEARRLYDAWSASTATEKGLLRDSNELLDTILKTITHLRRMKREENRDLDIYMYRWGYTNNLAHADNQWEGALVDYRFDVLVGPPYPTMKIVEVER